MRGNGLLIAAFAPFLGATLYCTVGVEECSLLRPDQRAYVLYSEKRYAEAAPEFTDPFWRAVALFRDGQFEQAAGAFAGFDSAEGAFNQGNALVMQGKYLDAVERYTRALELRSG